MRSVLRRPDLPVVCPSQQPEVGELRWGMMAAVFRGIGVLVIRRFRSI